MTEQTKQTFIERLRIDRVKWLALLDEVDPRWRDIPGVVGQWSVRDLVVHIAVWENWGANIAHSLAEGRVWSSDELYGVAIPPDVAALPFDNFNIWLTNRSEGRTYDQVCADERAAYWRFIEAFERLSEADLSRESSEFPVVESFGRDTIWELMANQTFGHYAEHSDNLRAWLDARIAST